MTIELRIDLIGIDSPPIWRQIKVPANLNFHQIHIIIQAAFGWRNMHLYQFSEHGIGSLLRICSPHDEEGPINAKTTPATSLLIALYNQSLFNKNGDTTLSYIYDYGDNWEHEIKTLEVDHSSNNTQLISGEGACPPEDCGGIHGFEDLKICLKTGKKSSLTGESWIPWLEHCNYADYNPEVFDMKEAQQRLKMLGW